MSLDRIALIRQLIEALNHGDWNAILPYFTADVVGDGTRTRGEYQRVTHGPDELRRVWDAFISDWEDVQNEIGDPTEVGDRVVVPISGHFRGRQGIELTTRPAWLFTFRGDKIAELCFYQDEREALEAAQTSRAT